LFVGKPKNQFAFNEQYLDVKQTHDIIQETHQSWKVMKTKILFIFIIYLFFIFFSIYERLLICYCLSLF
jgi:hypothetical protein